MIDLMKKFFGKKSQIDHGNQIKEKVHDIRIATCAILLEMAKIDGEFSKAEQESIISILKKDHNLSDEDAAQLLEASNNELKKSLDLWQFTNRINQDYATEEKIRIIEMVWKVIYTDEKLDKHEDYLVHQLGKLLRLTHKQLIDAKIKILHGS